jgi:hypothetical protein
MPKHQPTAAQAARRDTRQGEKYTAALRAHRTPHPTAPRSGHVLRFLARTGAPRLVAGITAIWARTGRRVLLLQHAEDRSRRPAIRPSRKKRAPLPAPEPQTTVLWQSPTGPGALDLHTCLWETRSQSDHGFPQRDYSLLRQALNTAHSAYDMIVLLPRHWSFPEPEIPTACVAIADVDDFPHTDCRTLLPGPGEETGIPLSPAQSAAVLRERYLSFRFGLPRPPVHMAGVIWQTASELPVEPEYLAAVDRDMDRVGLPTLGWVQQRWPTPYRLPEPDELNDPDYTRPYQKIAASLAEALDRHPTTDRVLPGRRRE